MGPIFISYRRDDAEGQAGRSYDDLIAEFGPNSVFMDVAAIQPGLDFRKAIDQSLSSCGVFLSVIGKNWAGAKGASGLRRLDDSDDFVRQETAAALRRQIPVIPVLVQGAPGPRPEQLPDDIKDLAYRNAIELTHPRWDSDVQLLIKALRPYVEGVQAEGVSAERRAGGAQRRGPDSRTKQVKATSASSKWWEAKWVAVIAIILIAAVGLAWYLLSSRASVVPDPVQNPENYRAILSNVHKIVAGTAPSPIDPLSSNWDIIVSGSDHSGPSAFVAVRQYRNGRIAAVGHESLLVYANEGLFDNAAFVTNLLKWLDVRKSSRIVYTTGHKEWFNDENSKVLKDLLGRAGLDLQSLKGDITKSALNDASVLIVGNAWGEFTPDEVSAVENYVAAGNGLLLAGVGWSWPQYHPDKEKLYPMMKIAGPYGIRWLNSVVVDPERYSDPNLDPQFKDARVFHTFFPNAR